ncbi:MAG: acylphosphatase [Candidatus Promineifilaceae bacterium]
MSVIVDQLRACVSGRVQGVSFRYYTRREAVSLGLTGWVRNERDGSVLVVAEGDVVKLEKLLTFLHDGPPAAIVDRVSAEWSKGPSTFGEFEIRWL